MLGTAIGNVAIATVFKKKNRRRAIFTGAGPTIVAAEVLNF